MSAEVVIIGEVLAGILSIIIARYKAAGVSEAEIDAAVMRALARAKETKPEDLPDV